jgi:hypothetical protein
MLEILDLMTSRKLEVGDIAVVTIHGTSYKHPIVDISDAGIYIDSNGEISVLVSTGGPWQVYRFTLPHSVSFEARGNQEKVEPLLPMHAGLTPVDDANMEILLRMDIETIGRMCDTSSDFDKICRNNFFWLKMLERDFKGAAQFVENNNDYRNAYKVFRKASEGYAQKDPDMKNKYDIFSPFNRNSFITLDGLVYIIKQFNASEDILNQHLITKYGIGSNEYTRAEMKELMSVATWLIWKTPWILKILSNDKYKGEGMVCRIDSNVLYYNDYKLSIKDIVHYAVMMVKSKIFEFLIQNDVKFNIKAVDIEIALFYAKVDSVKYFFSLPITIEGRLSYYIGADAEICDIIYKNVKYLPSHIDLRISICECNISKSEWIFNNIEWVLPKAGYIVSFETSYALGDLRLKKSYNDDPPSGIDIYDGVLVNKNDTTFVEMAKWVIAHNPNVVPTTKNIDDVLERTSLDPLIIYLAKSPDNIKTYAANKAYELLSNSNGRQDKKYLEKIHWMLSQTTPILPTSDGADYLCDIELLRILLRHNIRPTIWGFEHAMKKGCIEILTELLNLSPPISLTSEHLSYTIYHNMDDIAAKIVTINPSIITSKASLNYAVKHKLDNIIFAFATYYPPIIPEIRHILKYGKEYLFNIFIHVNKGWIPDDEILEYAIVRSTFDKFIRLYQMKPTYRPSQQVIDKALIHLNYKNYDTVKWALTLTPPVRPSQNGINKVIRSKTLYKIDALRELDLL